MIKTLTQKDYDELFEESEQSCECNPALESFEYLSQIPKQLGTGYYRVIEVYPELRLCIFDIQYYHDLSIKILVNQHPLQFRVLALGMHIDTYGQVGGEHTLISGAWRKRNDYI